MRRLALALCLLGCALLAASAYAALENISWVTLDSGSATASGGGYQLRGTFGQTDAGRMLGEGAAVVWGYWDQPLQVTSATSGLAIFRGVTYGDLFKAGAFALAMLLFSVGARVRKWSWA